MLPFVIALSEHDHFAFSLLKRTMSEWNVRYLPSVPFLSLVVDAGCLAQSSCQRSCCLSGAWMQEYVPVCPCCRKELPLSSSCTEQEQRMLSGRALLLHSLTAAPLSYLWSELWWELAEPGSQLEQITHGGVQHLWNRCSAKAEIRHLWSQSHFSPMCSLHSAHSVTHRSQGAPGHISLMVTQQQRLCPS